MPIERNDFDKPREYKFHRELIQDPNRLRDRIASSRDDEPTFNDCPLYTSEAPDDFRY